MANRRFIPGLLMLAPLLVQLMGTAAYAEDEVDPNGPDPLALEEIVVTANKREESIQEVPMSVTAFTSEFFKDAGVTNLQGLEQYTPSLKITPGTDSNSTSIRIRGIGSVGTNAGIDPSVGMFIDGVYQGRAGMSIGDLIDIERVEILRGPQGTLYGKNTAAGAISIITMAPSPDALESTVETTYNSDERAEIHAMVNVPLGDSGNAMRLTGYGIDGDHLFENSYTGEGLNNANKWGVKSRTLFDTSTESDDGFGEFLLTLDYNKEDTDCCALAVIDYDGLSLLNVPSTNIASQEYSDMLGNKPNGNPILTWNSFEDNATPNSDPSLPLVGPPPAADPFGDDYWLDDDIHNTVDVGGTALEWNKDVAHDNVLTFINAWRKYKSDSAYDGDFTAYNAVGGSTVIDFDQYSSELRLTSPGGATLDYQGGLYYYYSEMDSTGTFTQSVDLVNLLGLGGRFPDGSLNTDTNNYTTTSYAAFGQLVWNISDQFSTTLGLRFTNEGKTREGSQITTPTSSLDIPPVAGPDVFYDESRSDDDFSPTLIARYFVKPEIMTYASISRGFKSGGFNQRREVEGNNGEFDPETATNYEVGWKGSTEDRRLQLNGTVYLVNYDDFQAQAFDGTSITVTNAGAMRSYGSELELTYVPILDVVAGTAVGYNKAEYEDFDNGQCTIEQAFNEYYIVQGNRLFSPGVSAVPCTQDLAGKPIDNAPEWTVSSFVQYDRDLTENLVGAVRLEHSFIDSFYLDQALDPILSNDAVNLINLRFTLTNADNTWEAAIWGRNLLDEEYYAFGLNIPVLGGYAGVVAPEAVYGITVRFNH